MTRIRALLRLDLLADAREAARAAAEADAPVRCWVSPEIVGLLAEQLGQTQLAPHARDRSWSDRVRPAVSTSGTPNRVMFSGGVFVQS